MRQSTVLWRCPCDFNDFTGRSLWFCLSCLGTHCMDMGYSLLLNLRGQQTSEFSRCAVTCSVGNWLGWRGNVYIEQKRERAARFHDVLMTQSTVQDWRSKQAFLNLGALLLAIVAPQSQGNKHTWSWQIHTTGGQVSIRPSNSAKGSPARPVDFSFCHVRAFYLQVALGNKW